MTGILSRTRRLIDINHGTPRGWVRYLLAQFEGAVGHPHRFRHLDAASVERLVFVCLGNINRSAFAHAVGAHLGVHCTSIGLSTTTGAPATPSAQEAARAFDLSLERHTATDISDFSSRPGDLLLVMERRHAIRLTRAGFPEERIALLGHWARPIRYHIHDPHTLSLAYFSTCFSVIDSAVRHLARDLTESGSPCVKA